MSLLSRKMGWDCMEAIKMMGTSDVRKCVSKEGHAKLILSELDKLKTLQSKPQKQLSENANKSIFKLCGLLTC